MNQEDRIFKNKDLIQVSINYNKKKKKLFGYFMYQIIVTRGLRGKNKGKVPEVLIMGIPNSALENYCGANNLIITNKAVYEGDLDHPILWKEEESWTYKRREDLNGKK